MTFIPFLFGWTGNHPLGTKVVARAGIVVFLWIAGPYAIEAIRWLRQRSRDRGFIVKINVCVSLWSGFPVLLPRTTVELRQHPQLDHWERLSIGWTDADV